MDELIDFERLIDINEVIRSLETVEGQIQNISQNSLIDALDQMCQAEDRNAKTTQVNDAKVDMEPIVEESNGSEEDIINLDAYEDIFSEMHMSVNKLEKMEQKEFSITDMNTEMFNDKNIEPVNMCMCLNTLDKLEKKEFSVRSLISSEDSKENVNKPVDENNIPKETQISNDISIDDATVDLNEFEMIFNKLRVFNEKIDNKENMMFDTEIQNQEPATSYTVINLDDKAEIGNDHTIKNDENATAIDNSKQNYTRFKRIGSLELKLVDTSEVQKTGSDLIIDLDTTESDTELENLNKAELTKATNIKRAEECKEGVILSKKEDNSKAIADLKETDIISISSESEDDGYNSSDFEFISESEAKINNLAKTDIQSYTYYNADYMKYHKSRYLPCRVITSTAKRECHVIPQGEAFLDLFRGRYAPAVMNNFYYASKKRVLPVASMTIQDGYGFELLENNDEEAEEHKNEANETIKKIRFLYPNENRKRRRRF